MTKNYKWGIIVILLVLIGGSWWYLGRGRVDTGLPIARTFNESTTLEGNFSVLPGTRVVAANGATLTVNGDLIVQGSLECDGGPLDLRVGGKFFVEQEIKCNRPENLPSGDVGNSIIVVAKSFDITKEAVIISNGHVQMVTDESKLALTSEALLKLYDEAGKYRGEKWHIGPFTPLEEIPLETKGRPVSAAYPLRQTSASQIESGPVLFISTANAQEPAVDNEGNPVPGAIKIGGTWVVGNPNAARPPVLNIPTPPKDVNKIILNFDFGNNEVNIADFELTGPDGRPGQDDSGSCNVRGRRGEDAMRLLVDAGNIRVANFNLHLGSGGPGGSATTNKDCDPGTAIGGEGGSSGNFKMIASDNFSIEGAFNIFPGVGGLGGTATAYGKQGKDACAGENCGNATATRGQRGDNK